jgi:GR25 family glycosyltransferase involved in LPS biosynthesis
MSYKLKKLKQLINKHGGTFFRKKGEIYWKNSEKTETHLVTDSWLHAKMKEKEMKYEHDVSSSIEPEIPESKIFVSEETFNVEKCSTKYINLKHRNDRKIHMENELNRVGIKADRFDAFKPSDCPWEEHKIAKMKQKWPGTIGCHYSHVKALEECLNQNKHAFIMEDDIIFCSDIQKRFEYIENFLNKNEWDIFWLGSTVHLNPFVWHTGNYYELKNSKIGKDAEKINDEKIIRTYGCWSMYAYFVNKKSIEKILYLLDAHVHESRAIDWLFIKIQPRLKTYCFIPGCVKQLDNMSDISKNISHFSKFSKLGNYWWDDNMDSIKVSDLKFGN